MQSRKILYLLNPVSGTSKKEKIIQLIQRETKAQALCYELAYTNATGNYEALKEKVQDENFTDIVIVGGDGTVNQTVNAFQHLPVQFGIIPQGSGNGLALAAGIPLKPKLALQLIFKGISKPTDAFIINQYLSCMLSGLGFDAAVAHKFAHQQSRGLCTYTQQSLLNFFQAQPYQFEVKVNGFSFFTEAFFISIANSNQFGNRFTIAPKASLHDGLLDIVIVQKMNKMRLPFAILKQIKGNNKLQQLVDDISKKNILYFQTPSITIRNMKLAPFHLDGEPLETAEIFEAHVVKNCFRLIQP